MIRLAGLRPDEDIEIVFTGLRPGEKLHEELFHAAEALVPTGAPGILLAAPRTADAALHRARHRRAGRAARAGRAPRCSQGCAAWCRNTRTAAPAPAPPPPRARHDPRSHSGVTTSWPTPRPFRFAAR